MQGHNSSMMFQMLKMRFPHLDFALLNPQASFSENLQSIVEQIEMPKNCKTKDQIFSMKEAVDNQELKIQKSLVNQDGVLLNITNKSHAGKNKQSRSPYVQQQSMSYWQEQKEDFMMDDLWEFGSSHHHKDWFQQ